MRIKEVEELVGITRKNIRFYEKEGLLSPGRELENSYRDYTEADIRRLQIIKLLRKMDMPISAIGDVLEKRISLKEAMHLHSLLLDEQRRSVENAQRVCRMISACDEELETLNTEQYLNEIVNLEKTGTVLVDLRKKDAAGQYRETILVAAVVTFILIAMNFALVLFRRRIGLSAPVLWIIIASSVILIIGMIAALLSRLKEIEGGEENDLGNY